jgi:hypothetical protein
LRIALFPETPGVEHPARSKDGGVGDVDQVRAKPLEGATYAGVGRAQAYLGIWRERNPGNTMDPGARIRFGRA